MHERRPMKRLHRRIERWPDEAGFSMIELMIVVLVIAILIAIALPSFLGTRARAEDRAAQADLRTSLAAAMTYWANTGTYTGFDATTARAAEGNIGWRGPGAPAPGEVSIQEAAGPVLLLVGASKTGRYFCLAQLAASPATDRGAASSFAAVDSASECTGGGW
jgi:type IV pilus assembly protein PilA